MHRFRPILPLLSLLGLALLAAGCSDSPDGAREPAGDRSSAGAEGHPGRLLVVSGASDEVVVLDAEDGARLESISLDVRPGEVDEPHGIAVDAQRGLWYATLAHGEAALSKFDARDHRRIGRLRLGSTGAARIGITPDGDRAFVPSYWRGDPVPGTVTAVRLRDLRVLGSPSVCAAPHHAAVSPDGDLVLITCTLGDEVVLLDAETLEIRARVSMDPADGANGAGGSRASGPGEAEEGRGDDSADRPEDEIRFRPMNAAWLPGNGLTLSSSGVPAWVTLQESGEVVGIDPTGSVFTRITVGTSPLQIALGPDGRRAVVALRQDTAVAILDLERRSLIRRVTLPGAIHPHGVAMSPSGDRAWVSYEGTVGSAGGVVALTVPDGRVLWRRSVGSYVLGIAHLP